MEVFRIVRAKFANKLVASGVANRWNFNKQYVLYTSSSRSLSTLELVAHRASIAPTFTYKMMVIKINDLGKICTTLSAEELPKNWRTIEAYPVLQKIGGQWYDELTSLILKVPSVIIPKEFNYIINTAHPDFDKKVKLADVEEYFWDDRLL